MIRKKLLGKTSIAVLALALSVSGCSQKKSAATEPYATTAEVTTSAKAETTTAEETLSPEQMDLIKYNYYVELNNDLVRILDNIDYYYQVVEYAEDFALIPDSGHTYGYRVIGLNMDILDDCLELADMEPAYDTLDPIIKEMADPLLTLMDAFSEVGKSNDYADNQYQKAKELHTVIYQEADIVEPLAHEFINAVGVMANERIAKDEEQMKEEGRLIAYNASHGITLANQVIDECHAQGINDFNITELDLTNIKPLYEELLVVIDDLNAATADNEQMIQESMSNSRPFDQLYERMAQALEWMIKQVESGQPIEDPSLEPLGSLSHFSNTLGDCIDRYNTVLVD